MAHTIVMPSFGMYTVEGTLVAWLCPGGTRVEAGQPVLAIETDKATHEVPAPASGILHPVTPVGSLLKEQDVVGYILVAGEEPPPAPTASPVEEGTGEKLSAAALGASRDPTATVKATPIARRLAAQHGLDLSTLPGTGPGGRIVEADVLAAAERRRIDPAPAAAAASRWPIRQRIPLTGMRGAISRRLRQALDTAISLTLTREVEADGLVSARHRLADALGRPMPFDALFIRLLAIGLRECPTLNAIVHGGEILLLDEVNIGFAVRVPTGLLVPVIHHADTAPLSAIARSVCDLAERARSGTITLAEMEGGSATLTNLGDHGVDAFTPVLNPPQSAILGLGRIRPRPVVRHGAVVPGQTCMLSLTFDHRVEDGVEAARLLEVIARLMNDEAFLHGLA